MRLYELCLGFRKLKTVNIVYDSGYYFRTGMPRPEVITDSLLVTNIRSINECEYSVKCVGSSIS